MQKFVFLVWRQDFAGSIHYGDIYYDLAEAMRYAGENLNTPINWGGARDINGYVDITKWHSTIEELFESTWGDLMAHQEYDLLPYFQYFQLHAE